MTETIPQITNRYLTGKTLQEFAGELGIGAAKQSIQQWKDGVHVPSIMTLFLVIGSYTSTPEAREWARECIMVLQAEAGMDLDKEVERRR